MLMKQNVNNDVTKDSPIECHWFFYPQVLAHETLKNAQQDVQKREVLTAPNVPHTTLFKYNGEFSKNIWFSSCLIAVLGSQGIMVQCTVGFCFGTAVVCNCVPFEDT